MRVKVCGITSVGDARTAVHAGADAIGLVFWPRSPRAVDVRRARRIVEEVPRDMIVVGLFVDQSPDYVATVVEVVGLGAVQLHGDERLDAYRHIDRQLIKAVPLEGSGSVAAVVALPDRVLPLLDAHDPRQRGGTGRTIDWSLAAEVSRRRPVVLAGGLTTENLVRAVTTVRPAWVDVSSGVERQPGAKDPDKVVAFVRTAREAEGLVERTAAPAVDAGNR